MCAAYTIQFMIISKNRIVYDNKIGYGKTQMVFGVIDRALNSFMLKLSSGSKILLIIT